jgi:hypothetical protein
MGHLSHPYKAKYREYMKIEKLQGGGKAVLKKNKKRSHL